MPTDLETTLKAALADLVNLAPHEIPSSARFSDLGMDSLVGLRFSKRLKEQLDIDIEFEWLFDYPNVGELARFLETLEARSQPLPG